MPKRKIKQKRLTKEQAKILHRYIKVLVRKDFRFPANPKELAGVFNISRQRIYQLIKKARTDLKIPHDEEERAQVRINALREKNPSIFTEK